MRKYFWRGQVIFHLEEDISSLLCERAISNFHLRWNCLKQLDLIQQEIFSFVFYKNVKNFIANDVIWSVSTLIWFQKDFWIILTVSYYMIFVTFFKDFFQIQFLCCKELRNSFIVKNQYYSRISLNKIWMEPTKITLIYQ